MSSKKKVSGKKSVDVEIREFAEKITAYLAQLKEKGIDIVVHTFFEGEIIKRRKHSLPHRIPEMKIKKWVVRRYIEKEYPHATLGQIQIKKRFVIVSLRNDRGPLHRPFFFYDEKYHAFIKLDENGNILMKSGVGLHPSWWEESILNSIKPNGWEMGQHILKTDFAVAKKKGCFIYEFCEPESTLPQDLERQLWEDSRPRCQNPDCLKPLDKTAAEYKKFPFCNNDCKAAYEKRIEELNAEYPDYDFRRGCYRPWCKWCGEFLPDRTGAGRPQEFCDKNHYKQFKDLEKKIKGVRAAVPPPSDTDKNKYVLRDFKENPAAALHSGRYHDEIDELWLRYLYLKNGAVLGGMFGKQIQEKLRQIPVRRCEWCGGVIPAKMRPQSRFCSIKCKDDYNNQKKKEKVKGSDR